MAYRNSRGVGASRCVNNFLLQKDICLSAYWKLGTSWFYHLPMFVIGSSLLNPNSLNVHKLTDAEFT